MMVEGSANDIKDNLQVRPGSSAGVLLRQSSNLPRTVNEFGHRRRSRADHLAGSEHATARAMW